MKKSLFIFLTTILLFSCSQNLPELSSASGYLVYEFENETDLPEVRLGVFLDVVSDVHRADKIRVECVQNNYIWDCLNPVKIESGKKKYSGYSNFVMPDNKVFPAGKYMVWYTDSNGNESSTVMNISITEGAAAFTMDQAVDFMVQNNGKENVAVSDENSVLLHYGEKSEIRNLDEIWNRYPAGDSYRIVWTRNNGKEIFVLPVVWKNPGAKTKPENEETSLEIQKDDDEENKIEKIDSDEKKPEEKEPENGKDIAGNFSEHSSGAFGGNIEVNGEKNEYVRNSESE